MINTSLIYKTSYRLAKKPTTVLFETEGVKNSYKIIGERKNNLKRVEMAIVKMTGVKFNGDSRKMDHVNARRVYCFLCEKLCMSSLTDIGKSINKSHSLVLFQDSKCAELIQIEDKKTIQTLIDVCHFLSIEFRITPKTK
jgi:chromosomal replication initiation ATPase DnaA